MTDELAPRWMARVREHQAEGLSFAEAVKRTNTELITAPYEDPRRIRYRRTRPRPKAPDDPTPTPPPRRDLDD
ncbi:MAG: hypothetical protein FJ038_04265 [Chloroflexi bacterium]|nr:hypothetical protein [Chloroflexota bacterium]